MTERYRLLSAASYAALVAAIPDVAYVVECQRTEFGPWCRIGGITPVDATESWCVKFDDTEESRVVKSEDLCMRVPIDIEQIIDRWYTREILVLKRLYRNDEAKVTLNHRTAVLLLRDIEEIS